MSSDLHLLNNTKLQSIGSSAEPIDVQVRGLEADVREDHAGGDR